MIDLAGAQPVWPAEARALFGSCLAGGDDFTEPARFGDPGLREWLGTELGADPDSVAIVGGARGAALGYARLFSEVTVEAPTFPGVLGMFEACGRKPATRGWPQLAEHPPAGLLWVTSPRRNPDGATATTDDLRRWSTGGARLVVNRAYHWFKRDAPVPAGTDQVGTLHKLAGVGARLGWVVSSLRDELIPEVLTGAPPLPWQRAWGRFLGGGGLELLLAAVVEPACAAAARFAEVSGRPATAPNTLVPVADAAVTVRAMAEQGFAVVAADPFLASGQAVRLCFTGVAPDEAERAALALSEVSG